MTRKGHGGLSPDDTRPATRYAGTPTEDTGRRFHEEEDEAPRKGSWIEEADPRVREAAEKYAASQGVDVNDERVIKYVRGLTSRTGDFGGREQESPIGWRQK